MFHQNLLCNQENVGVSESASMVTAHVLKTASATTTEVPRSYSACSFETSSATRNKISEIRRLFWLQRIFYHPTCKPVHNAVHQLQQVPPKHPLQRCAETRCRAEIKLQRMFHQNILCNLSPFDTVDEEQIVTAYVPSKHPLQQYKYPFFITYFSLLQRMFHQNILCNLSINVVFSSIA